jgi:hypothetical protein
VHGAVQQAADVERLGVLFKVTREVHLSSISSNFSRVISFNKRRLYPVIQCSFCRTYQ